MKRDLELDRLTTLLGQCLGRIDEQAYRLQQVGDEAEDCADDGVADVLENEAARLQELVGSLLERADAPEQSDLDDVVHASVRGCMQELGSPIVVRQRLAGELPPIACTPGQLAYAVQRALVLATSRLDVGGELRVTTRREDDCAVLELEGQGTRNDRNLQDRAQTLCEFVSSFRGTCRVAYDEQQNLLIVLELPLALAIDER
jgi:hypothetical protein